MSNTKHFADKNGVYIGGFGDGAKPPEGAVECPAPPTAFHTWNGSNWRSPPITPGQVNAERDRRLEMDFTFNGKKFQRDQKSLSRISGAASLSGFAIAQGAQPGDLRWHGGDADFVWIASDNTLVPMDAQTVFAFGQVAANVETRIIFAAKQLREMDPIPDPATWEGWPDV